MKKVCFSLLSLLVSLNIITTTANAMPRRQTDPCEPRVRAQPTKILCATEDFHFSIRIETLMSDLHTCSWENSKQTQTAQVSISAKKESSAKDKYDQKTIIIEEGEFSYTLSSPRGATFKSDLYNIDLQGCATPANGGFSVGN